MATDIARPRSRRALLTGAAAGVAVFAAEQLAKPLEARAADGEPVLLGQYQDSSHETSIQGGGLRVEGGVLGFAMIVHGVSDGPALLAASEHEPVVSSESTRGSGDAIHGESGSGTGVRGSSGSGAGVVGISATDVGVFGQSDNGVGVHAEAGVDVPGVALDVAGRMVFTGTGRVSIPQGSQSVSVDPTPVPVSATTSQILVTLLGDPKGTGKKAVGVYLSHVEIKGTNAFDIVLSGPCGRAIEAAFFIVEMPAM